MKLGTFEKAGNLRPGVIRDDRILDLEELLRFLQEGERLKGVSDPRARMAAEQLLRDGAPPDMIALLKRGTRWLRDLDELLSLLLRSGNETLLPSMAIALSDIHLCAPVPAPAKIVCVGRNYAEHAQESGHQPGAIPVFFVKSSSAILGPGGAIRLPLNSSQVDYEAEFAVVMGQRGKDIPPERAYDYVAGYTLLNDVSARDMQEADGQWFRAKSCDTFAPMGPWLITRDEIPQPDQLRISLDLNGKTMQDSNTNRLIFNIPFLISYLSKSMTWEVGDILSTGTPSGVGAHRTPPVFLRPGDVVSVRVEGVGVLTNIVGV